MADLRFYSWPIQWASGVIAVLISIYFTEIRQVVRLEREALLLLIVFLVLLFGLRKRVRARRRAHD